MSIVVIEGLDGAGKSTQIALLGQYLEQKGRRWEYLHFPRVDAPFFGDLVARFLRGELGPLHQVDPYVVALIYAADRMDAAKQLRQWLQQGKTVLLDRYVYSNVAFQCAKLADAEQRKALRSWILELEHERMGIPRPALSIFLDVPFRFTQDRLTAARQGEDRRYLQGKADIHEASLDLQQAVRQVYLEQPPLDPSFQIVCCASEQGDMLPPEQVHQRIVNLLHGADIFQS